MPSVFSIVKTDTLKLILVAGKGGVGKSTVAMNLILRALCQGRRALHVVVDLPVELAEFIRTRDAFYAHTRNNVGSRYCFMNLNGRYAFREYVALKVPGGSFVSGLLGHSWVDTLISGAPGVRELVVMGKIVHEVQSGRWDIVVVDMPSSGHAFDYLKMPLAAAETFSLGKAGRESKVVTELLKDPKITCLLPVTTPEELPVSETTEFLKVFASNLGVSIPCIVVNKFQRAGPAIDKVVPFMQSCFSSPELVESVVKIYSSYLRRQHASLEEISRLEALDIDLLFCPHSSRSSGGVVLIPEIAEQ